MPGEYAASPQAPDPLPQSGKAAPSRPPLGPQAAPVHPGPRPISASRLPSAGTPQPSRTSFSETVLHPLVVRSLAVLYLAASAVCCLIVYSLHGEATFNFVLALFFAVSSLLAGLGLWNYWRSGRDAAILANLVGIIASLVAIQKGSLLGVLVIALNVTLAAYVVWVAMKSGFGGSAELDLTDFTSRGVSSFLAGILTLPVRRALNRIMATCFLGIVVFWILGIGHAKTYTSKENQFTISAPKGWVVAEIPQTGAEVSLVRPDPATRSVTDQPCVSVYVASLPEDAGDFGPRELMQWKIEWVHKAHSPVVPTSEPTIVAGYPAWKIELRRQGIGPHPSEHWLVIVVKNEARLYTFRCACPDDVYYTFLPEFEQAMTGFAFTP